VLLVGVVPGSLLRSVTGVGPWVRPLPVLRDSALGPLVGVPALLLGSDSP
jgi:hypothetical protein